MGVALIDMPDAERMALRSVIEGTGCTVESYDGDCFVVAVPRAWRETRKALFIAGFEWVGNWLFPLGTDCNWAPVTMKHDGGYPQSFGFWMYARLRPLGDD